ncbi:hypothetical protein KILIM_143_00020 [Kineosphaera limosa NBRC 100340]|uniref:Uncharacterized protein n=1 Tax=Kineosphaera limosa NBRC 100340 TaxID=1184609 RepID=K6WGH8_9MICO|nr:hypothetical protein KILIM_143_00020 [Kineosphaera limosa NBRC 100340]
MRVDENDQPGAGGRQPCRQIRCVEAPSRGGVAHRDRHDPSPGPRDARQERRVGRHMDRDAVAGCGARLDDQLEDLQQIREDPGAISAWSPPEAVRHPPLEGADHRITLREPRVAEVLVRQSVSDHVSHRARHSEVHVCDPGGQYVWLDDAPLDAGPGAQPVLVDGCQLTRPRVVAAQDVAHQLHLTVMLGELLIDVLERRALGQFAVRPLKAAGRLGAQGRLRLGGRNVRGELLARALRTVHERRDGTRRAEFGLPVSLDQATRNEPAGPGLDDPEAVVQQGVRRVCAG